MGYHRLWVITVWVISGLTVLVSANRYLNMLLCSFAYVLNACFSKHESISKYIVRLTVVYS